MLIAELIKFNGNLLRYLSETLVKTIYALALDKLKDKDGVFEIRKYFEV